MCEEIFVRVCGEGKEEEGGCLKMVSRGLV